MLLCEGDKKLPRGEKLNRRAEALLSIVLEEMLQHTGGSGLSRGMASSARPKKKSDKKKEPSKLAKLRAKTEARGKFNNASMNKVVVYHDVFLHVL